MRELLLYTATVFMGFFAIMNPIANTPLFLSLSSEADQATKKKIARNALVLTFVIIVVFSVAGRLIFELFGITMPAFRIAGGVLVFLIGFHMLQGEQSRIHKPSDEDQANVQDATLNVAVSPLAMPILAGPGTIATALNFTSTGGLTQLVITTACFLTLCIVTYFCFTLGERLTTYIGSAAINAVTRIMGMVLTVIGTQMLIDGITDITKAAT